VTARGPYSTRRWVWVGALSWTVLALVYLLGMGLRRASYGLPFLVPWSSVTNSLVMTLVGAALTPLVLLAFRRGPAAAEHRSRAALWYVAIGIAYWLAWAVLVTALAAGGVIRPAGLTLGAAVILMAYISLTAYAVLVMLYEGVRSLHRAREKELEAARLQAELSRAQAARLRARLNPEFVFDSLTTASALMDRDARAARRVLADLGGLLRASLGQNGGDLVSCHDELELLQRYVDIQRARPGHRLRVKLEVEPGAADAVLPPLVLQPVVEELVREGTTRRAGEIVLDISATRVGRELRLRVLGSGPGLESGAVAASADGGVSAARARLRAVYGDRASVSRAQHEDGVVAIEMRVPQGQGGPDA
jgi:two-component system, LytTR family, sensor kinase